MKCRHEWRLRGVHAEYAPGVESPRIDRHRITRAPIRSVLVDSSRCMECGAWLSLGPSNDRSERVRMEREAARIAVEAVNDWPDYNEGIGVEIGWEEHQIGSTEELRSAKRWTGYLARCIATHHDEAQP